MPAFHYRAWDISGRVLTGTLISPDRAAAQRALRHRELFVAELSSNRCQAQSVKVLTGLERTQFFAQLAELLHAGVPLLRSLDVVGEQAPVGFLKEVVNGIRQEVARGSSLAESLQASAAGFDRLALSMIQAGEEGGFLDAATRRVATYLQQSHDLKKRTFAALVYPALLLATSGLVVLGMLFFLIPRFKPIFVRMEQAGNLPLLTSWVLDLSHFLQANVITISLSAIVVAFLIARLPRNSCRSLIQSVANRLPVVGPIVREMSIARFCRVLGTLLTSGVPLLRSLQISKEVASLPRLRDAIARAAIDLSNGSSLVEPLRAAGEFPRNVVEMIAVGEKSNQLDRLLVDLADRLERQTQQKLEVAVKLIEPAMLVLLAVIVLLLVVALLLPMLQMAGRLS